MIVDSNIIIDLFSYSPDHSKASLAAFKLHASRLPTLVNHVIFAEVSPRFGSSADVRRQLDEFGLLHDPLNDAIAFRAGEAFREYRRRGGPREAILPDFFIGAHAEVLAIPILTRDPKRYASYFATVELLIPEKTDI